MKQQLRHHQGRPAVTLPAGVRDWARWMEAQLYPPELAVFLNYTGGAGVGVGTNTAFVAFPAGVTSSAFAVLPVRPEWILGTVYAFAFFTGSAASTLPFEVTFAATAMRSGRAIGAAGTMAAIVLFAGPAVANQPLPVVSTLTLAAGREPVRRGDISVSYRVTRTGILNDTNPGALRLIASYLAFLPAS